MDEDYADLLMDMYEARGETEYYEYQRQQMLDAEEEERELQKALSYQEDCWPDYSGGKPHMVCSHYDSSRLTAGTGSVEELIVIVCIIIALLILAKKKQRRT